MLAPINTRKEISRNFKKKAKGRKYWRPTVVVVLTYGRKVLFALRLRKGVWGLPKGGIERIDRKCLIAAAQRELAEELGLAPSVLKPRGYLGSIRDELNCDKKRIGKYFHVVHVEIQPNGRPKANRQENVESWRWVDSILAFKKLNMRPRRRQIWLAALQQAKVPWAMRV